MTVLKAGIEWKKQAMATGQRVEKPVPNSKRLYLVSQPSGAQSWAIRYRAPADGKQVKLTLGPVGYEELEPGIEPSFGEAMDLDAARLLAERCHLALRRKIDPRSLVEQQAAVTEELKDLRVDGHSVEAVFKRFMAWYAPGKTSTKLQTARLLGLKPDGRDGWTASGNGLLSKLEGETFSRLDGTPVLTVGTVNLALDTMPTVLRNRTRTAFKQVANFAEGRSLLTYNIFAGMKRARQDREEPRYETLSDTQIRRLWRFVMAKPDLFGMAALLILTTGQRPSEVLEARYEEFDFAEREWTIPAGRMKAGKEHTVPLSSLALELIAQLPGAGPWLFETNLKRPLVKHSSAGKTSVIRRAGIEGRTFHDLRRTAATGMGELGIAPYVIDAVLAHSAGRVTRTYQRYDYAKEKAEALEAWGQRLAAITSEKPE